MTVSGKFSSLFRTGESANSSFEKILESLNLARGTAYEAYDITNTETAVYAENYAIAEAINDLWESNQRMANQFDPVTMSVFIPRWETILGIIPESDATEQERKAVIGAKFALLANAPIHQTIKDLCIAYLGDMFVEIMHYDADDDYGGVPGGCTVPGGVTLDDDVWFSPISTITIRTWQIRDNNNNYLYSEQEYLKKINSLLEVLYNFLPCYNLVNTMRFLYQGDGTVTGSGYDLIGSGTDFVNDLAIGDLIEIVDDNDELQTYTVSTITDATNAKMEEATTTITGGYYRIMGFYLDFTNNLNNLTFGNY